MKFVNNWNQPVTLAAGVTTLALELEDGEYRLTLADDGVAATRWEVVGAVVSSGTATLQRGQEGTTDQDWPAGSVIYIAVTAGWLNSVEARLAGAGVTVSDSLPGELDVPAAPGALYVVPGEGGWMALAAEHGSDWVRIAGEWRSYGFVYPAPLPGHSYDAPYGERSLFVEVSEAVAGTYPATLVMPWVGAPHGLSITINPNGSGALALSMDFSAMAPQVYAQIENKGVADPVLSIQAAVVTVTVSELCELELRSFLRGDEEVELDFLLQPATPSTFVYPQ